MCTVTFSPRKRGYALAMNRDEQLTRATGLPPDISIRKGHRVLAPSEPGGGTWISLNENGTTFALINWYAIRSQLTAQSISRGEVVNFVSPLTTAPMAAEALGHLPLQRINPFRLIGIFPDADEIVEWWWDLNTLSPKKHAWRSQQWVSSGYDEPAAQQIRGKNFRQALKQESAGSLSWLRQLHRSHSPSCGPFSTCMHRSDAATVSYTEVSVSPRRSLMRSFTGAPCQCASGQLKSYSLNPG